LTSGHLSKNKIFNISALFDPEKVGDEQKNHMFNGNQPLELIMPESLPGKHFARFRSVIIHKYFQQ
jgi:hypothetical protein